MGSSSIRSLCLWAVALAVVVAVAGCGGGSDNGGSSASETTSASGEGSGKSSQGGGESTGGEAGAGKPGESESSGGGGGGGEISDAKFVKQANEICEEGKKQSLAKMGSYVQKHKQKGASQKRNLSTLREAIQAVIVPGIAEQVEEIRALGVSGADKAAVSEFLAAMEAGVESAEQVTGSSTNPFGESFKHSAELAREIGLDACAYG